MIIIFLDEVFCLVQTHKNLQITYRITDEHEIEFTHLYYVIDHSGDPGSSRNAKARL